MLSSLDLRGFKSLREKIQEEIDAYIENLDGIPASAQGALNQFIEYRAYRRAYEDVLVLMAEIEKSFSE